MPDLPGRNGYTNAELVELWPAVPEETCDGCSTRGVVTWTVFARKWCAECFSRMEISNHGGHA